MKRLLFLLILIPFLGSSQLKISEMPTYSGNPDGMYFPGVLLGTNRKINGRYFGYDKIDSMSVAQGSTYDTIYVYKNKIKAYYKLIRAGGGGASSWTDLSGKPTTISGFGITDAVATARGAMAAGYGVVYNPSTGMYTLDTAVTNLLYTTPISFGPGFLYSLGVVSIDIGNRKVVPDANYTVTSADRYLILPDPAATRTITLPAASSSSRPISIECFGTVSGEWILSGSFVQKSSAGGSMAVDFINSGLAPGQLIHLVPIVLADGTTWRWFDLP